jgi:hypothetical protein
MAMAWEQIRTALSAGTLVRETAIPALTMSVAVEPVSMKISQAAQDAPRLSNATTAILAQKMSVPKMASARTRIWPGAAMGIGTANSPDCQAVRMLSASIIIAITPTIVVKASRAIWIPVNASNKKAAQTIQDVLMMAIPALRRRALEIIHPASASL